MNKNKSGAANTAGLTSFKKATTYPESTPNRIKFQYFCSFCAGELFNNSILFRGVGACPACNELAHYWVKSLREYDALNCLKFGGRK